MLEHAWLSGLFGVTAHEPSENGVFYWTDRLHFLSPAERCPQLPTFKRNKRIPTLKQTKSPNNLQSVGVLLSHADFLMRQICLTVTFPSWLWAVVWGATSTIRKWYHFLGPAILPHALIWNKQSPSALHLTLTRVFLISSPFFPS